MTETSPAFRALQERRRRLVISARENDIEEGLRSLLSDLYPDNAHFIYELLQNAEDVGAENVHFDLRDHELIVSHDGKRAFTLKDINSITSIGNSTKSDDETSIGKFGVGFKAVFAYSSRPVIRSGDFSFAIEDMFVPEPVPGRANPGETTFQFPLDGSGKTQEQARAEIERGLRALSDDSLLFLRSIRRVTFSVPGGSGSVARSEVGGMQGLMSVRIETDGTARESHWLRLTGPASGNRKLYVGAAFAVELDDERSVPRIRPIKSASVSIFFPAEKESSGLKFHMHAPFASTVARDVVRDVPDNRSLVADIGVLIARSLPALRDAGLLDDDFLAALPNDGDEVADLFAPIADEIKAAFNSEPLTRVWGDRGSFAPAQELLSSPSQFRRALRPKDLPLLLDLADIEVEGEPRWIADADGRAGAFLAGLGATNFGWGALEDSLDRINREFLYSWGEDEWRSNWQKWLEDKPDKSLRAFYELIGFGIDEDEFAPSLQYLPIVRLKSRGKLRHVKGHETYLPSSKGDRASSRVPPELAVFDGEAGKAASSLRAFYSAAGVERWDDSAKVRERLAVYEQGEPPAHDSRQHLSDVQKFIEYAAATGDYSTFKNVDFLWGEDDDPDSTSGAAWCQPSKLYLDEPILATRLGSVMASSRWRLSEIYARIDDIEEFAERIGCATRVTIERVNIRKNPRWEPQFGLGNWTSLGRSSDWDIPTFGAIVSSGDPALFASLWNAAVEAPADRATAMHRQNNSAPTYRMDSRIAQRMKSVPWVLGVDGELHLPQDIGIADLPDDFRAPRERSLAMAVGFGANEERQRRERAEQSAQAEALGMELDDIEMLRDLLKSGITRDELRQFAAARANAATRSGGGSSQSTRMISYVAPASDDDRMSGSAGLPTKTSAVDKAGIARVLEYEKSRGRVPEEQTHSNPGFDIISRRSSGKIARRIEVKSVSGEWGDAGVLVSATQFQEARDRGNQFWLYVVENAQDDDAFRIHRIQNPAGRVDVYGFDRGWTALTEADPITPLGAASAIHPARRASLERRDGAGT